MLDLLLGVGVLLDPPLDPVPDPLALDHGATVSALLVTLGFAVAALLSANGG